jgi:DNA-binding NarL/FixJ family response regulator
MSVHRLRASDAVDRRPPAKAVRRIAATISVAVVTEDPGDVDRVRLAFEREGVAAFVEAGGRTRLDLDELERRPAAVVLIGADVESAILEAHGVRRRVPGVHVVLVLAPGAERHARHVLGGGVDGVVLEPDLEVSLPLVVRSAFAGQISVPRSMRYGVELPAFSHRERQILRLVAAGSTNDEIARRLYLSKSTVGGHLTAIFRRLGVRSREDVVALILDADESVRRLLLGIDLQPGDRRDEAV